MKFAVLGAGCFWCVQAIYKRIDGIVDVESGYAGSSVPNPTYQQICSGTTGHAEVVRITYDPNTVSFTDILEVFWKSHDPTTLNRQGADVGSQYRSIILYTDEEQKQEAIESIKQHASDYTSLITTEIVPMGTFYAAEDYHQDYYERNRSAGYCVAVISPKLRVLGLE